MPPGSPASPQDQVKGHVKKLKEYLTSMFRAKGIYRYQKYFLRYVFCEGMTLANLIFQIALIDRFLGGMFTIYGPMVFEISSLDPEDRDDPLNLVFPKAGFIFSKNICHIYSPLLFLFFEGVSSCKLSLERLRDLEREKLRKNYMCAVK